MAAVIVKMTPGDRGTTRPAYSGFLTGGPIAVPAPRFSAVASAPGTLATPATPALAAGTSAAPRRAFADIFYFRIWVIPTVLDAQNPVIGSPIPFRIWNAYLTPNDVDVISGTGDDGLTFDFDATASWDALEFREVNITIGVDAPYQIDANFNFDFQFGDGQLRFLAQIADIIPLMPDAPVLETYTWMTDQIQSYNGTEQRIAVRQRPRRSFTIDLTLLDDADRKKVYDKIYKTIALTVIAPSYQYQAPLKVATVIGDNKIYCNVARADLRAGENVVIVSKSGLFYLYEIEAVFAGYATITTAFAAVLRKGSIVAAGFQARIPNNTAISMGARSGKANLKLELVDARDQIAQPGASVSLATFAGYPVLERRPLADSEAGEAFDMGLETIDNKTGRPAVYSNWLQPFVNGSRKFLIQSLLNIADTEYWRVFLDHCNGMQRAFLLSTYREDLVLTEGVDLLVAQMTVDGSEYANQYFESPTYKNLEIETDQGTFWVTADNVVNNGVSTTISFSPAMDIDPATVTVIRISYLVLARLGSDTVTFSHNGTHSSVEFPIRAALE